MVWVVETQVHLDSLKGSNHVSDEQTTAASMSPWRPSVSEIILQYSFVLWASIFIVLVSGHLVPWGMPLVTGVHGESSRSSSAVTLTHHRSFAYQGGICVGLSWKPSQNPSRQHRWELLPPVWWSSPQSLLGVVMCRTYWRGSHAEPGGAAQKMSGVQEGCLWLMTRALCMEQQWGYNRVTGQKVKCKKSNGRTPKYIEVKTSKSKKSKVKRAKSLNSKKSKEKSKTWKIQNG